MSRLLKVLPFVLGLAIVALAIFAASCSSSSSHYRVVNAIPDGPNNSNFDIQVNGTTVFTSVGFGSTEPSSGYQSISSGSDPIAVFLAGTTTNPVIASTALNLGGGTQYSVFLTGTFHGTPAASLKTDNNTTPSSGSVEFRIVDASSSAPTSMDIYIVPPGTDLTQVSSPDVSGLQFGTASSYVSKAAAQYEVAITTTGSKVPLFTPPDYTLTAGQIRTLVLVDVAGGGALSSLPLELSDLN